MLEILRGQVRNGAGEGCPTQKQCGDSGRGGVSGVCGFPVKGLSFFLNFTELAAKFHPSPSPPLIDITLCVLGSVSPPAPCRL